MKMLARAALVLSTCLAMPALADPVVQTGAVMGVAGGYKDLVPGTIFNQSCNGGLGGIAGQSYAGTLCTLPAPGSPGAPSTTSSDPANASFSAAVGPLVAGTDYSLAANNGSTGANTLFRAINVTCSSAGAANLTLTGGGVLPYTFASGPSYQIAFVLKSIDAVPAGCVLYGLK